MRRPRHRLSAAVAGIWTLAVAVGRLDARLTPDPAGEAPLLDGPLVSVVVPARNEARGIGAAVRSHLDQRYRQLELIVVDDESTDGTGAVAQRAAAGDTRLRVVTGAPPPEGWVGKSWACHQGVRTARGAWLLFSDADVIHHPDALGRCLALARRLDRGGLTLAPRVDTVTAAERVVMPAAIQLIRTMVAPGVLARLQRCPITMAAGAFILVRRDVYDAVDGHAGVGHHMVDDLSLARAVKRSGALLVPADGTGLVHLRMYHGLGEMWRGWRKNAAFAAPVSRTRGMFPALLLATLGATPLIASAAGVRRSDPRLLLHGGVGLAAQCVLQRGAAPIVATPRAYAPTFPLGTLFIAAAATRGAVDRLTGRGPVWRGRRYPHAAGRTSRQGVVPGGD